jgi:hypothetical protein
MEGPAAGNRQAALGKAIYTERCASCRGGDDGKYDPLVGGRGTLNTDTSQDDRGYRPYADPVELSTGRNHSTSPARSS